MNKCKVYLKGAYGPGNLGDDVLMISIVNVLKECFKSADIVVGVEEPELAKYFDSEIRWVHYKVPFYAEYVVYGGGGQFFSFKGVSNLSSDTSDHNLLAKVKNFLNNNRNVYHAIQRLLLTNKGALDNLIVAEKVASYCIGLGPFEVDGKGVNRLKQFIHQIDYCSLRDNTSAQHYLSYGGEKEKLNVFKDPSFNAADWFNLDYQKLSGSREYISYILRDWPYSGYGQNLIQLMAAHAKEMKDKGRKVQLVSLCKEKDQKIIAQFPEFEWLIYDVEHYSIEGFMQELLGSSKYICSARAHGVWLPTILGFPVMAVGIENKLIEVQKNLNQCSHLTIAKELNAFNDDFEQYCSGFKSFQNNIDVQVSDNKQQAVLAKQSFIDWVESN